jgi:fructose-1-phosphate kinase PfkB-like protein
LITVLDAAREALEHALPAEPDLVSPNLAEAEALLTGRQDEAVEPEGDDVLERAEVAARALRERGARAAVVSAGRHGLAVAEGAGSFVVRAPRVPEVNPIGAGDSLVAGLAVALERGATLRRAVAEGVATAAASVAHPLAGGVDAVVLAELMHRVEEAVA